MGGNGRPFQYLIAFGLLFLSFKAWGRVGEAKVVCKERERDALLQFKRGVVDDFGMLSSWGNGEDKRDCCINWRGVECDKYTGHVISLDLYRCYLGGRTGPSLAELQHLKHLKHLNLSWNQFEGN